MPSVHLQIIGIVQGVGFRWFARVAARRLQLSGWVTNRSDGSVEVAASGPVDKLEEFRRVLERGPNGAEVTEIRELDPVEPSSLEFPFALRRKGAG
jgi:acylphosphatase